MKALIILAISLVTSSLWGRECPNSEYTMICRGKLPSFVKHDFTMFLSTKNDRKSGEFGKFLKPNTCAWIDRPISPTESADIYFERITDINDSSLIQAATECLSDQTCTLEFCAKSAIGGYIFADYGFGVMRRYPVFQ